MRKPGGQIDEVAAVSRNVKQKDLQTCNIIMDFKERKVVKCVVDGNRVDTNWEKLSEYYKQVYPNVISQIEKEVDGKA
jgi:hypothetical protein